jgi:hypothetical protein
MFDYIRITADYSNAVLVALLPIFSQFVEKADLPMPTPITVHQVERFVCNIQKSDSVGGYLVHTNGLELWFHHGHVRGFRTPRSYYNLQDPAGIPRFYGPLKLNKDEALELGRELILNLGYTLEETFTDQEPQVEMPPRIGTNLVPHYRFQWSDPVFGGTAVSIEVDGNRKLIHELWLSSRFFWRAPPKIAIEPRLLNPKPPVSAAISNAFLTAMLPRISDYAEKLKLPVTLPIRLEHLQRVEFLDADNVVMIKLTNGYWFDCERSRVAGFTAPDSAFAWKPLDRPRPIEEYLGEWKLSEGEAIEFARGVMLRLGFSLEDFSATHAPVVRKRKPVGKYVVPRYFVQWTPMDESSGVPASAAWFEVDAHEKGIKHAYVSREPFAPTPTFNQTNAIPYTVDEPLGITTNETKHFQPDAAQSHTNNSGIRPLSRPQSNPFE